jgi:hypothetical protein
MELELEPTKGWLDPTKYSDYAVNGVVAVGSATVNSTVGLAKGEVPGLTKEGDIDGAAAFISALGQKNNAGEHDVWFSGYFTQEFVDSINDAVSAKNKVAFPWIIAGWATKELAESNSVKPEKEENYKKVTIHATKASGFAFAGNRIVLSRFNGVPEKGDGDNSWNIAGAAPAFTRRDAWQATKDGKPIPTPQAAPAPTTEAPKAEAE